MDFLSDFEMMLQRKKSMSGKRRRNRDGGTFISDADDVVSAMIVKMNEAAEVGHFRLHPSSSHKWLYSLFCFFGHTLWLAGSEFPTRDWTHVLGSESTKSKPLDHQGIPALFLKKKKSLILA